eukprot:87509_1
MRLFFSMYLLPTLRHKILAPHTKYSMPIPCMTACNLSTIDAANDYNHFNLINASEGEIHIIFHARLRCVPKARVLCIDCQSVSTLCGGYDAICVNISTKNTAYYCVILHEECSINRIIWHSPIP